MLRRVSISCLSTCSVLLSAAMSVAVAMVARTVLGGGGSTTSGAGWVGGRGRETSGAGWLGGRGRKTSGTGWVGGKFSCSLAGVPTCYLLPGVLSRLVEGVVTIGIGAALL